MKKQLSSVEISVVAIYIITPHYRLAVLSFDPVSSIIINYVVLNYSSPTIADINPFQARKDLIVPNRGRGISLNGDTGEPVEADFVCLDHATSALTDINTFLAAVVNAVSPHQWCGTAILNRYARKSAASDIAVFQLQQPLGDLDRGVIGAPRVSNRYVCNLTALSLEQDGIIVGTLNYYFVAISVAYDLYALIDNDVFSIDALFNQHPLVDAPPEPLS